MKLHRRLLDALATPWRLAVGRITAPHVLEINRLEGILRSERKVALKMESILHDMIKADEEREKKSAWLRSTEAWTILEGLDSDTAVRVREALVRILES
jgi:hypothetical protein